MKSEIKERNDAEVCLEVTVESDRVNQKLDEIYQKAVQEMDLPGFRKGKVPKSFVKARFGEDVFYEDAQNELLEEFLPQALEEKDLKAVSEPETEIKEFERDQDFVFEATVEVLPEIDLGQYKGLEITDPGTQDVTEENIEERLQELQEEHGQLVPKDEDVVESGDYVVLSGPEGNTEQVKVEDNDDPLKDLIGKSLGEEVRLPKGTSEEEEPSFLTIEEIKEMDLPAIDDEFAKDLGYEELQELRTEIKSRLFEEKEEEREDKLGQRILEEIIETSEFPLPEKMIQSSAEEEVEQIKEQIGSESFAKILEGKDQTEEELLENLKQSTREDLRKDLVLKHIADQEDIEVTDEDLEEEIKKEAQSSGVDPIKFKNQLRANDKINSFRQSLTQRKVLEFLIDSANLTSKEDNNEQA